jgi:RimJ/RimL family protein N-acetyltransferase
MDGAPGQAEPAMGEHPDAHRSGRAAVILRPTIPEDLPQVIGEPLPYRIRAITALLLPAAERGAGLAAPTPVASAAEAKANGKVIGIGGIAFPPDGTVWAFVQQSAEAKRYPVAFHRAGLAAMKMIRAAGLGEVRATADRDNEAALRWLRRLGFVEAGPRTSDGKVAFIWRGAPAPSGAAE